MRNHGFLARILPWPTLFLLICFGILFPDFLSANSGTHFFGPEVLLCDNVTDGGSISGDEIGCPNPIFDPSLIENVILPSGGSGNLEYVWMYTTEDPSLPVIYWHPLPNSNSAEYDPGPITMTTWYRRCSRRSGCSEYVGETDYVTKEVKCCENVVEPGTIGYDQKVCAENIDPNQIIELVPASGGSGNLVYTWYSSTTGLPFDPLIWDLIPGADQSSFDPGTLMSTTWFVRTVRREDCTEELASTPVVVELFASPFVSALITDVDCYSQSTGAIDLTVTGGVSPYSFDWSNAPDIEDPSGLQAGTYQVTVVDANGCSSVSEYSIGQPTELILSGVITEPSCFGDQTGSVDLTVSGGTPGYIYIWNTGATTSSIVGLGTGMYAVTVTDQNSCPKSAVFNVNGPVGLIASISYSDVRCAGSADGELHVAVSGGTSPYTFLWNNGATTADVENLAGGAYTVTATDAKGCTLVLQQDILEPPPLSLELFGIDPTCEGGSNGETSVLVSGGTLPYQYLWNDASNSPNNVVTGLSAGVYTVTVTDGHDCTAAEQISLADGIDDCDLSIGDFVWLDSDRDGIQDNGEYGENGILVKLVKTGPDGDYGTSDDEVIDSTYTSGFGFNTGYYLFHDVQPGTYSICFVIDTSAFQFTVQDAGGNDALDSDASNSSGCVAEFTILSGGMDDLTFDAGIHARCDNVYTGGEIGYDEVLCAPGENPDEIVNILFPTGGTGQFEYLWLRSELDPNYFPGNPNWIPIPNSNTPNYDPSAIQVTTYYIRCARRAGCWNYPGESNIVTKSVVDPNPEIIGPAGPLCMGEDYFYMAANNGPNATYFWDFGPNGHPQTATTLAVNNVSWDAAGIQTISLTVNVDGCIAMSILQVQVDECGGKHVISQFNGLVTAELDVDLRWFSPAYDMDHVYVVERSIDGITYQYLSTVLGKSNVGSWYSYRDLVPEWGENIYKIRMVSAQGVMANSDLVRVLVKEAEMFNVILFPNPFRDLLTIRMLETLPTETHVDFYDILGRKLHQEVLPAQTKTVQVNCKDWPSGPVLIWVSQEGKRPFSLHVQKVN